MSYSNNKSVSGQDESLSIDAIKRQIKIDQASYWYESETKKKHKKFGAGYRFGAKGSLEISEKNGEVVWYSHEDNKGGSIIDLVMYATGVDDVGKALQIVKDEILNIRPSNDWKPKPKEEKKTKQARDPKEVYKDLDKCWQMLRDGLRSEPCIALFKLRGLDETKIETLGCDIGYAQQRCKINGFDIPKGALVFRDGKTAKWMTFDATGHRNQNGIRQITGGGNCHWMPKPFESDTIYLVEGEFDAIALHFLGLRAVPLKPEKLDDNDDAAIDAIVELCKSHKVYIAYDNDDAGHKYAKKVERAAPCTDITTIWDDGDDPNGFVQKYKAESKLMIEQKIKEIDHQETQSGTHDPALLSISKDMSANEKIKRIQKYFYDKNIGAQTQAAKRAMQDDLISGFVSNIDPYSMRSHASAFCLIGWGMARLSMYRIESPSNPRIINLVAKSSAGKDWVLGTHTYSHSIFYQLKKEIDFEVYQSSEASITGNGMSKSAFLWAANPAHKNKVRGMFWPEFGNAQTRGYGQEERAGSIGNFDVSLCNGTISKPQNKADLKELQEYDDEYQYKGFEVRAFQDINAAKVVIPRMKGSGEARREFWLYMTNPIDDPTCSDLDVPFFEAAFKESAYTDDGCDKAWEILRKNALPVIPVPTQFDEEPATKIKTSITGSDFLSVYEYLMGSQINTCYSSNRYELLRDKLQYLAGLSAGIHGRFEAVTDDYWIAAWLCECLSNSLDMIFSEGNNLEVDPRRSSVIEMIKTAGEKGVYRSRLLTHVDGSMLDELCGQRRVCGGIVYDEDAPLVYKLDKNRKGKYIAREFIQSAMQHNPDLRDPSAT